MSITTASGTRWLPLQFLALALAWGSSFLFIKVGLTGLSPMQVVAGRMAFGALALAVVVAITRARLPRAPRAWAHLSVVSLLLCVLPFSLFAWAEQRISSGLASIYNATTPLMTTAVTLVALRAERPRGRQLAGLCAGLVGVLTVLAPWRLSAGAVAPVAG
ncbi:DMT family transporter, partial [Saccharomonospora saliphila]|uniref:DMT family transporter n=1 Tax=Saccharomonospora saliphila TaxID=369829 RepID=UPI0012FCB129